MEELELRGEVFSAYSDYWLLFETLSRRLEEHRVAILRDLEDVHPRAAAAVTHLCDDAFPPFPQVCRHSVGVPRGVVRPPGCQSRAGTT